MWNAHFLQAIITIWSVHQRPSTAHNVSLGIPHFISLLHDFTCMHDVHRIFSLVFVCWMRSQKFVGTCSQLMICWGDYRSERAPSDQMHLREPVAAQHHMIYFYSPFIRSQGRTHIKGVWELQPPPNWKNAQEFSKVQPTQPYLFFQTLSLSLKSQNWKRPSNHTPYSTLVRHRHPFLGWYSLPHRATTASYFFFYSWKPLARYA